MRVLPAEPAEGSLAAAHDVLSTGGLVVFRTDTLYGVSASWSSSVGLARLRAMKEGPEGRPFLSLAAGVELALGWSRSVDPRARGLAGRVWPGPVTLVLEAGDVVPRDAVAADGSWAVRVPDDAWCRRLAELMGGALPSSSANRSGEPPVGGPGAGRERLEEWVELLIDAGEVRDGAASALVDLRAWPPAILRGWLDLEALIRGPKAGPGAP